MKGRKSGLGREREKERGKTHLGILIKLLLLPGSLVKNHQDTIPERNTDLLHLTSQKEAGGRHLLKKKKCNNIFFLRVLFLKPLFLSQSETHSRAVALERVCLKKALEIHDYSRNRPDFAITKKKILQGGEKKTGANKKKTLKGSIQAKLAGDGPDELAPPLSPVLYLRLGQAITGRGAVANLFACEEPLVRGISNN